MEYIYLLLGPEYEWEDILIITNLEEVIEISKKYPDLRVEVFIKNENKIGYSPTYNYYKNGSYICNDK